METSDYQKFLALSISEKLATVAGMAFPALVFIIVSWAVL